MRDLMGERSNLTIKEHEIAYHNERILHPGEEVERTDCCNILLVDDCDDSAQYISHALKPFSYKIDRAENGAIGVGKFEKYLYDLVLMDIQMPIMGGYTATLLMREWERQNQLHITPIIAISANIFEGDKERSMEVGCNEHLRKPIEKDLLRNTVRRYLYISLLQKNKK